MKLSACCLFVAFSLILSIARGNPTGVADLFGTRGLQIVKEAERLDACILRRVGPAARPDGSVDWNTERYEEGTFVSVGKREAGALRRLLLDEKTYDWDAHGGRRPEFYVRLRFHRQDEMVTINLCFLCKVLEIRLNDQQVDHANFSGNADLILQACLKAFPNDMPLQKVAKELGL